jgi:UDP-3-O-[3-hydroxymyristoyl] glucosamine N-acyltransferase
MSDICINDILKKLEGYDIEFDFKGQGDVVITHVRSIGNIEPHSVAFYRGNNKDYNVELLSVDNLIITSKSYNNFGKKNCNYIFTNTPDLAFCIASELFEIQEVASIHPTALVSKSAQIDNNVAIDAYTSIGKNVVIGKNVSIGTSCFIENAKIGDNVTINSGVRIGTSGLGSHKDKNGLWHEFPHVGLVLIGEGCVIQDNSVINRGTLNDTCIDNNVRVGPLCWIGHGVKIGASCFIAQSVTIAGSVEIGDEAIIWSKVAIRDGVTIGREVVVGMGSIVVGSVPHKELWLGSPAKFKGKL